MLPEKYEGRYTVVEDEDDEDDDDIIPDNTTEKYKRKMA